jgi:hypothetical protein
MIRPRRSGLCAFVVVLIPTMAITADAGAGTKKAPPPTPKTPLDQFNAQLEKLDPKAAIIRYALPGSREDEAMVVVQNAFHRAHYQERLQVAQGLWLMWKKANSSSTAAVVLVDIAGNHVGRVGPTGSAWVQKP